MPDAVATRRCGKCHVEKVLDEEFYMMTRRGRRERRFWCKTCCNAGSKAAYAKRHPAAHNKTQRRSHVFRVFGITQAQYDALLEEQGCVCAICGGEETKTSNRGVLHALSVDHCHETGQVRGLLCGKCNVGLGHFRDSPEFLEIALLYLTRERGSRCENRPN